MTQNRLMISLFIVSVVCCVSLFVNLIGASPALRVIGGRDSKINEFPYVVQLEKHFDVIIGSALIAGVKSFCTGSVLKPAWTLTAGHCAVTTTISIGRKMQNKKQTITSNEKIMIRYGYPEGKASKNDSLSAILKFVVRPKLRAEALFEDVGLANNEPILVEDYAKISALDFTTLYGHEVSIAGFGVTNESNILEPVLDMNKPLQIIDKAMVKKCDLERDLETQFPSVCVAPHCRQTAVVCIGDSGGPVIHPSGVIGVVSRGPSFNCEPQHNRVIDKDIVRVTPLSPFIDWISDVTSQIST